MQPAKQPDSLWNRHGETVLQYSGDLCCKQKLLAPPHLSYASSKLKPRFLLGCGNSMTDCINTKRIFIVRLFSKFSPSKYFESRSCSSPDKYIWDIFEIWFRETYKSLSKLLPIRVLIQRKTFLYVLDAIFVHDKEWYNLYASWPLSS